MAMNPKPDDPHPEGYQFIRKTLRGRRFVIPGRQAVDCFNGCVLSYCEIDILVGPLRFRSPVDFHGCLLSATSIRVADGRVAEAPWTNTTFEDCTFSGKFRTCGFGDVPHSRHLVHGAERFDVVNCSFDEAILDQCVFYGCALDTCRMPAWPHVLFRNPWHYRDAVKRLDLPESFGTAKIVTGMLLRHADEVVVWHLPSIDPECDLKHARRVLSQLPCVEIIDSRSRKTAAPSR